MGSCTSKDSAAETLPPTEAPKPRSAPEPALPADLADFVLTKLRPGCTGMFWRSDPRGQEQLLGGHDWPQDNATLRGVTIEHEGEKWLKVYRVRQVGGNWVDVFEINPYIPFEYDDHYHLVPTNK